MSAYSPPPGYGPPTAGPGSPGWTGQVPPARPRTPLALVGCAILTAVLVVVGSFPKFGETRVDDLVSSGSGWRGYSGPGGGEATTVSTPGQGVTFLLAAATAVLGIVAVRRAGRHAVA